MGLEEYQVEQERRVNSLITEVATLRESVKNNRESFSEVKESQSDLKKGQAEIQIAVQKLVSQNEINNATLKLNIDAQINTALSPLKAELAALREEALIRKTQLAMIIGFGIAVGNVAVYFIKLAFGG